MLSPMARNIGVLAVLAVVAYSSAASAQYQCPSEIGGRRLQGLSVFEGDPAKQVDLAPAGLQAKVGYINVWDLRSYRGLIAVCRYDGGQSNQSVLPQGVKQCRVDSTPRRTVAVCE